jgi:hypothetical protein
MVFKKNRKALAKPAALLGSALAVGAILLPAGKAWAQEDNDHRIQAGYAASPVPLYLKGKDPAQVGIGSYIVNGSADCDGCHSTTVNGVGEFTANGNPYTLPAPAGPYSGKTVFNPAVFVGGGANFGANPSVFSKNLTPAANAAVQNATSNTPFYASGGIDWPTFLNLIRSGYDLDQNHPPCTSPGTPYNCTPTPANGKLLQVMIWPHLRYLTDNDINAIWQYLSAVPCLTDAAIVAANPDQAHQILLNVCQPGPSASDHKYYAWFNGQAIAKP